MKKSKMKNNELKKDSQSKKTTKNDICNEKKATVTFGLGATLNAGDYETVRVNFSLSLDCAIDEVQKTIKKVKSEVKKQMQLEINEIKGLLKK